MTSFTTDESTYDPADPIVCTIADSTEAPSSAELRYGFFRAYPTIQEGATTTEATVEGLGYDAFVSAGAGEGLRWEEDLTLILHFPTEDSSSQTIQISPGLGVFYQAGAQPWPVHSRHEKDGSGEFITVEGDDQFFLVEFGGISSISSTGVLLASTVPLRVSRTWFNVSQGIWSAKDTIDILLAGAATAVKAGVR